MAGYKLLIKPSAAKEIEAIGAKRDRQRLVNRVLALAAAPRPAGCQKLAGVDGRFRIRQGQYRVIFSSDDTRRVVEIVKVGHRSEVYRGAR